MRKKIIALIASIMMLTLVVGCSNAQGVSLLKEFEKVQSWDAISEKGEFSLDFKASGDTIKLGGSYSSYSTTKDLKQECVFTLDKLEVSGEAIDLTSGRYKIAPIKCYIDTNKLYISSSYIKDFLNVFVGSSEGFPIDLSKEYVGIELEDNSFTEQLEMQQQEAMDMYKNLDLDVKINQEGSKYSINLKGDEMVNALFELVNKSLDTQKDMLVETYKSMGLTDEEAQQLLAEVKQMYGDETKEQIKPFLKNSNVKIDMNFKEDSYTTDMNLALDLDIMGEKVTGNILFKGEVSKAEVREIQFPTDVKMYTEEELMETVNKVADTPTEPANSTVYVEKASTFIKDGEVYVPLKSSIEQVGLTAVYDTNKKVVIIKEIGQQVDGLIIKNGVSYISSNDLEDEGIECMID